MKTKYDDMSEKELKHTKAEVENALARKGSDMDVIRSEIQEFANKHKCVFKEKGEVGFGRPCVGITRNGHYLDINPINMDSENYDYYAEFFSESLRAPDDVIDAYHKHECLCVLANGERPDFEEAIRQLHIWIKHLEEVGVEVVDRENHFKEPLQALFSGPTTPTLKVKEGE